MHSQGTTPDASYVPSPPSPIHVHAAPPYAPHSTSSTNAPDTLRPDSPLALFHRDARRLFEASSTPRLVPAPYSPSSHSHEQHSTLKRDRSGIPRASTSCRTQTDIISIRAETLVCPILRGLVSLAAMQVLTTFDKLHLLLSASPTLWALYRTCLVYCLRPMLRGVHFTLIWIGVVVRILSAIVVIVTPDPM